MSVNPAKLVATLIQAVSGLVDGTGDGNGWRLFRDTEPTTPDTAVTIYNVAGGRPNPRFLLDFPAVQVRVRAASDGQDDAFDKLAAIKSALLGITPQDVAPNNDRVVSITMAVDITSLGRDENGRPRYVATFNMIVQPTATADDQRIAL